MALTYSSPWRTPERILTIGVGGVGKSNAVLQVAEKCPDATFYVVDTDYADSYNRALDMQYADLKNVEVHRRFLDDGDDFDRFTTTIPELCEKGTEKDWLIVDSMSPTWSAASAWYTDRMFSKDIDEYIFEKRKARGGNATPSAGQSTDVDWDLINKTYFKRVYNAILQFPGHVYMTAEMDPVANEGKRADDRETRSLFGPYGVKPRGQKKLGHVPSTVLMLSKSRVGDYAMTTIKDRNRTEVEDQSWDNFLTDYLVKCAGWKPARIDAA